MLREVCKLLNDAGLRTTPSCEGHSYPRQRFTQIWSELKREEPAIQTGGLVVRDCENERQYQFRDVAYRLPWESEDQFYRQAAAHQELGYLGILSPGEHSALPRRLAQDLTDRAIVNLRVASAWNEVLGSLLLEVHVNAAEPEQRAAIWSEFTQRVRRGLEGQA